MSFAEAATTSRFEGISCDRFTAKGNVREFHFQIELAEYPCQSLVRCPSLVQERSCRKFCDAVNPEAAASSLSSSAQSRQQGHGRSEVPVQYVSPDAVIDKERTGLPAATHCSGSQAVSIDSIEKEFASTSLHQSAPVLATASGSSGRTRSLRSETFGPELERSLSAGGVSDRTGEQSEMHDPERGPHLYHD